MIKDTDLLTGYLIYLTVNIKELSNLKGGRVHGGYHDLETVWLRWNYRR